MWRSVFVIVLLFFLHLALFWMRRFFNTWNVFLLNKAYWVVRNFLNWILEFSLFRKHGSCIIKKKKNETADLLAYILLYYLINKLHYGKCFVWILLTRCKTLETHSFVTLTRSFLEFCNSWIKIRTAHFLWSNLYIYLINLFVHSPLPCLLRNLCHQM